MLIRRPRSRVWFEEKVAELVALVRQLPRPRQLALFEDLHQRNRQDQEVTGGLGTNDGKSSTFFPQPK